MGTFDFFLSTRRFIIQSFTTHTYFRSKAVALSKHRKMAAQQKQHSDSLPNSWGSLQHLVNTRGAFFFSIHNLFFFFFWKIISSEFDRGINRSKPITFSQSEWNRKLLKITENMYHLDYFPPIPESLKGSQRHTSINYESSMAYCQHKFEILWLFQV